MKPHTRGAWRPRLVVQRLTVATLPRLNPRCPSCRAFTSQSLRSTSETRPNLPFLYPPSSSGAIRYFTSTQKKWFKHEMKLVVRYTLTIWGVVASIFVFVFAVTMEMDERRYPTPHEWSYFSRAALRLGLYSRATQDIASVNWMKVINSGRDTIRRLEDPTTDGQDVARMFERHDPEAHIPYEFSNYDISAKSEEWRRGYFEAHMLVADSSQHVEGWLRDEKRKITSPPQFVFGPSNPHPLPLPPGNTKRPREEDCVPAFPPAEEWFVKILATRGFSSRQRIEAALAYAKYMSYTGRTEGVNSLHELALAEAVGAGDSQLSYDRKTFVLNDKAGPPSASLFEILTDVALHKVRDERDTAAALPIFISLLRARRSLPAKAPTTALTQQSPTRDGSILGQIKAFATPPAYPSPPSDGRQPPWRSPEERCQEASLNAYIGELLFATSSRDDGLAWTRDAVDASEEELRKLQGRTADANARQVCRECLRTSLGNWSQMVATLASEQKSKTESGTRPNALSFWSGSTNVEGRWEAEQAVVDDRIRRTEELVEEVKPPSEGILKFFMA